METRSARRSTIRRARERNEVGLREFARRMGVTPKAVTDWERSEEQGTAQLKTIERALSALGEQLLVSSRRVNTVAPESTLLERREDRVALELHRAVAKKLVDNPQAVLKLVPANLRVLRERVQGLSLEQDLDEWQTLTEDGPIGHLVEAMLSTEPQFVRMRQTSPFQGVLSQDERIIAINRATVV